MHPFSTLQFSDVFEGRERCIGNKWVNTNKIYANLISMNPLKNQTCSY